jgi:hypothetical protein
MRPVTPLLEALSMALRWIVTSLHLRSESRQVRSSSPSLVLAGPSGPEDRTEVLATSPAEVASMVLQGSHVTLEDSHSPHTLPQGIGVEELSNWRLVAEEVARQSDAASIIFLDGNSYRERAVALDDLARDSGRQFYSSLAGDFDLGEPFDIWQGGPQIVVNLLLEILDWGNGLDSDRRDTGTAILRSVFKQEFEAPRSGVELMSGLARFRALAKEPESRIPDDLANEIVNDLREFFTRANGAFEGQRSWGEAGVSYVSDRLFLGGRDKTLRLLLSDLLDYLTRRKDPRLPCVIFLDAYSTDSRYIKMMRTLLEVARARRAGVAILPDASLALGGFADNSHRCMVQPPLSLAG